MGWEIEYYSEKVEEKILELPKGLLARYLRLTDLMLEFGPNLGFPHTKVIKNELYELRIKSQEGIARVFYCTIIGNKIMILHVFIKKTKRIPKKELKIAIERLKKVKKYET